MLERVLQQAGKGVADIGLVAVSIGPGSFTGLRIGLSAAKGIALSTGCDLVSVPTLEALAHVADGAGRGPVCTVLDARKSEVYGALFQTENGGDEAQMKRLVDECVIDPASLAEMVSSPCVVLGDGVAPYRETWQCQLPSGSKLLSFDEYHPRGGVVARLGLQRHTAHGADPLDATAPRYCRRSEAEINHSKERMRSEGD